MNKCLIFGVYLLLVPQYAYATSIASGGGGGSGGGMQIKKASAVQEQPAAEGVEAAGGTSLVGTALSLFQGIQALKKEEKALTEACVPRDSELTFVNKMVQEYAKIGKESAEQMLKSLDGEPKDDPKFCSYETYVQTGNGSVCYESFRDSKDDNKIWKGYPKASLSNRICPPNKAKCSDNDKERHSNIYKIYAKMDWQETDLLPDEISLHAAVMKKIDECDPSVLKRKKQEMTGNLITSVIGGVGQKQNTGGVMQQVGGLMQNTGGGNSNLMGGLGSMGTSLLPSLMGGGM